MAVAWFINPILDESAPVIDRDSVHERTFGVSKARRHPAYVYSTNKNACLMHKIASVTIHWYAIVGMSRLGRLKQPAMIAQTVCSMNFALTAERTRTCTIPEPDAVLCGRCHGEPHTFGKHGRGTKNGWDKRAARVKLGCEVAGYPSAFANDEKTHD